MSFASKLTETASELWLDEEASLNEMATIVDKRYGLGISIKIYSEDHPPAHMHVFDLSDSSLIARIIIQSSKPSNVDSIRSYGDKTLTNTQKKIILKAMLVKDRTLEIPMWKVAKHTWDILHPEFPS